MSEETVLKAETGKPRDVVSAMPLLLVGTGAVILAANLLHIHLIDFLWPSFIIGPGLVMLWPAYQSTPESRSSWSFLAVPGAMAVALGGLLFLMNLVNHFESMAYVWTLVLAAGAQGYAYMKRFEENGQAAEKAYRFVRTMLLAFMGLATIFELFIFRSLGDWWPVLLIGLGIYMFFKSRRSETQ
jgi:vacuolar-type H+-ATPase subunit I/STV1